MQSYYFCIYWRSRIQNANEPKGIIMACNELRYCRAASWLWQSGV